MNRSAKNIILYVLCLLMVSCATAYDKRGVYHKIRKGESIWKVARYYHVSIQDLAEWNNIHNTNEFVPGIKLYIPRPDKEERLAYKKLPGVQKAKVRTSRKRDIVFENRFIWPVNGQISSKFGIRNGKRHDGLDIRAPKGTPIVAAANGTVVYNGRLKGYGNTIILKHKDKYFSVYAHNSKNRVKKGQKVAKGRIIGYVGATGRATGPHVHFEVRQGQKARNPEFLLPASGSSNVQYAKKESQKSSGGGSREEMMERLKAKKRKN